MTIFNRRSALKLGGSLLAATALTPHLAFAQGKTINYWHTFTSQSEQAGLDEVLKLFAAAHPDITVTPENIPNPEFMAKITAAVVANTRPSVTGLSSERFRDLLAMGALTDITDRVAGWERRADFADAAFHRDHCRRQDLRRARLDVCRLDLLPQGLVRSGRHRPADNACRNVRRSGQAHRCWRQPFWLRASRRPWRAEHHHQHDGSVRFARAARRWQHRSRPREGDRRRGVLVRNGQEPLPRARPMMASAKSSRASRRVRRR